MLESKFKATLNNGQQIRISHVMCNTCKNVFFVPSMGENEPSFCCYCGIKFVSYTKENSNGQQFNIAGFPIKKEKKED